MLIRKTAMDEVGLLDEGYWLYMDDLDWCYRFKQAGWRVVYDGRVSSLHVKGGTTKEKSHRGLRHNLAFHRSMGRFYRKFYAGRNPLADFFIYLAIFGKLAISVDRGRRSPAAASPRRFSPAPGRTVFRSTRGTRRSGSAPTTPRCRGTSSTVRSRPSAKWTCASQPSSERIFSEPSE